MSALSGDYTTVTELPGSVVTEEQLLMAHTRYRLAADLGEGQDLLEVACGPGLGLGFLARRSRRVVAGDCDPKLVEMAREHYGGRIEIRQVDAEELPFEDESFDVVLLLEAIYYLPQPERFLAEARRVLRENGTVFICSVNREWSGFNPSPFSFNYYSAHELEQLLGRNGFTAKTYAAFPATCDGVKNIIFSMIRRIAARLRLIPRTMRGKGIIKRVLYGKLRHLPPELTDEMPEPQPLVSVNKGRRVSEYKVIYAIGRLSSPET